MPDLYARRKLSEGYPGLGELAYESFTEILDSAPEDTRLERLMTYLGRLVEIGSDTRVLVLGCGPRPVTVRKLAASGLDVVGVEPVPSFVEAAGEFVGSSEMILHGEAEHIPLPDASQGIVLFESVLEHVDSPIKSLEELHRVLVPGGIAQISTTNRHCFSPTGHNGEFNVRFFNWFPALVQECFVFEHLHYRPELANGTERPAVHWFCYTDLCRLGRQAGFAQFYSLFDLLRPEDPSVRRSRLRRLLLRSVQRRPWLRALALTQLGGNIVMLKRI